MFVLKFYAFHWFQSLLRMKKLNEIQTLFSDSLHLYYDFEFKMLNVCAQYKIVWPSIDNR